MSGFSDYIGSQFACPRGIAGRLSCAAMNVMNRPMYQLACELILRSGARRALDIGCGNGRFASLVLRRGDAELWGVDPSAGALAAALEKNRAAVDSGRLHLSAGDCCALNFPDCFFDAVSSINTVYFWTDPLRGLREIRRVLEPGGCFFNLAYTPDYLKRLPFTRSGFRFFTSGQLKSFGHEAGFARSEAYELEREKSFAVALWG